MCDLWLNIVDFSQLIITYQLKESRFNWNITIWPELHKFVMAAWWLWLRDGASVLLSEGRWFNSPGLHVEVSLGKILLWDLYVPKRLLVLPNTTRSYFWMWQVAGSIHLASMLKCPWARYWTPNCSWCAGRHPAWQPPPSVYECMNYCQSLCPRCCSCPLPPILLPVNSEAVLSIESHKNK